MIDLLKVAKCIIDIHENSIYVHVLVCLMTSFSNFMLILWNQQLCEAGCVEERFQNWLHLGLIMSIVVCVASILCVSKVIY